MVSACFAPHLCYYSINQWYLDNCLPVTVTSQPSSDHLRKVNLYILISACNKHCRVRKSANAVAANQ